ncbi:hypothetical protein GCM10010260_19900 [Streptomyces filipinensis]|uniref:Uncharacterized protein n=1 Tax=Streptomyces filipinensis TaxID=66887 RepID=A0A918M9C7_9ACTN|nr:hypothetical protein [Streptomyces filipinensis]GGU86754.1 hypothetical protein GCM10010260_19900 [Streptomyces filipinensis]
MFVCAGCGAELTVPLARVALPARAGHRFGHVMLPALMEPGTYAVDAQPWGPPWRRWEETGAGEAAARGVFAPVPALSFGPRGSVVLAPGDVRGTVLVPGRCDGSCMGPDGRDGPNLACAGCGRPVATRIDDCSQWQAVRLHPPAVRRFPGPAHPVTGWDAVVRELRDREERSTPAVEPGGGWSPHWEAGASVALAHLLAASAGEPVALPGGLVADVFGRVLARLLPSGAPRRTLSLAGPGLPAVSGCARGIALVPVHPQTGEAWQPAAGTPAVPLPADVWSGLAFPRDRSRLPVTGGLPRDVQRDDPLPLRPWGPFVFDRRLFLHTLARLPEVRRPWLRRIHDRACELPWSAGLF